MLYAIFSVLLGSSIILACYAPCDESEDPVACGVSCTPGSDEGCPAGTTCQQSGGYWQCKGASGAKDGAK